MPDFFSDADLRQLVGLGITAAEAERQLDLLLNPPPSIRLDRPCRLGDGIRRLEAQQYSENLELFESAEQRGRLSRFIPASGAASRMFKTLLPFLTDRGEPGRQELQRRVERGGRSAADLLTLVDNLERFAFHAALEEVLRPRGLSLRKLLADEAYVTLCRYLLTADGLNYAELPKALIEFHRYPEGARTALQEQLVEGAAYVLDSQRVSRNHFTVPPGQAKLYAAELERMRAYESRLGIQYRVDFSTQERSSDTLALGPDRRPFRSDDGTLLLRPGGHGALIENLNALGGDIVFIKNIDNILPQRLQAQPVRCRKLLCGTLLALERSIHDWIRELRQPPEPAAAQLERCFDWIQAQLGLSAPPAIRSAPLERQRAYLLDRLLRPLRICAVVPNQGEPGGGPFWVAGPEHQISPQIVEHSQIDSQSPAQEKIWSSATHFNPVDMVCGLRDPAGVAYDLSRFIDPMAVFVARKSHQRRELLALERPGLWNGAMAHWNTVLVEVPAETFAPVKTVFDLLRPEHQDG